MTTGEREKSEKGGNGEAAKVLECESDGDQTRKVQNDAKCELGNSDLPKIGWWSRIAPASGEEEGTSCRSIVLS